MKWGEVAAGNAGTTQDRLDFRRRRHRRRRTHPLHADRRRCIAVNKRIANGFSSRELRSDRADKTIAGAGGINSLDGTARRDQRLAVDERQRAALAERHTDDFVLAGLQRSDLLREPRIFVSIAQLLPRPKSALTSLRV